MLTHHSRNPSQHIEFQKKLAKAERVRKLWSDFELWLRLPRNEMERSRDQLLLQTSVHNLKSTRRKIEEAHFSKAREEWQRRLRAADLKESDWDPMNEAEMKAVEEALGVNDEEGYITDPSPSPPHRLLYPTASSASSTPSATATTPLAPAESPANRSSSALIPAPLVAPPMTSASRATSASSSSYECVRPEEFHSDDDDESTSDSEISFSTTLSSIVECPSLPLKANSPLTASYFRQISEEDESVVPVTEFIFSQAIETDPYLGATKDTNGPLLTRNLPIPKPVDPGPGAQPPPSLAPPKRPPDVRHQLPTSRSSSSSSTASTSKKPSPPAPVVVSNKSSPPVASSSSKSSSSSTKSARVHYPLVAPSLSDLSDYDEVENDADTDRLSPSLVEQFEAQFEDRKLVIRIEKIRQFHHLAAEADVALSRNIAQGRRDRTLSRQAEADLVQKHYESNVALRDRLEKERKEQVNLEKKRLRDEYVWRSSSSNLRHESDSEDDQAEELQKKWMRMMQEQEALQAKFSAQPTTRKRASTLTLDSVPLPTDDDGDATEVSTPRPAPKSGSAWSSIKPPATRSLANVLGHSISRKEPVEIEQAEPEAEQHDDADNEKERETTGGIWSILSLGSKKKPANVAPPPQPQPAQSPWNFATPQKPTTNARSRLGIVTSAWDDDLGADGVEEEKQVEKEELPQEKTPVIPAASAPNVSPTSKKQTKKQRLANKKGGGGGAPAPAPPLAGKGPQAKTAPVGVPGKSGKKETDDISSTPRPNVLAKRLQALANEESVTEQEDETPTTPRPPVAKKGPAVAAQAAANPWSRGINKASNKNVVDPAFDDDVAADSTPAATSSSKKTAEPAPPGAWSWGSTNDKNVRKTNGPARPVPTVDTTDSGKKKGKKVQRANAHENTTNGAKSSAWTMKKTTVEEVPDDDADDSLTDKLLPHNSRSIIEEMHASSSPEEQPRIHEPRPSKPRAVFDNIFQYGEGAPVPDPGLVHDLQDELSWSQERIAQAVARMAQESAEMDRKVNGLNGINGLNGFPSSASMTNGVAGVTMNGSGHVNMANMNRVNMNGSVNAAVNGFGLGPKPVSAVDPAIMSSSSTSTSTTKKQVRWQQPQQVQPQPQPSNLGGFDGFDDHPRSQPLPPQSFMHKLSRSYDADEAFSPLASGANGGGFSGFPSSASSASASSSLSSSSYVPFGRNPKMNVVSQFGGPFTSDEEPEGDDLDRAARNFFDNIQQVGVSSQQRNKPGFSAV